MFYLDKKSWRKSMCSLKNRWINSILIISRYNHNYILVPAHSQCTLLYMYILVPAQCTLYSTLYSKAVYNVDTRTYLHSVHSIKQFFPFWPELFMRDHKDYILYSPPFKMHNKNIMTWIFQRASTVRFTDILIKIWY